MAGLNHIREVYLIEQVAVVYNIGLLVEVVGIVAEIAERHLYELSFFGIDVKLGVFVLFNIEDLICVDCVVAFDSSLERALGLSADACA